MYLNKFEWGCFWTPASQGPKRTIVLDIINYLKPIYVARTQTMHDPLMPDSCFGYLLSLLLLLLLLLLSLLFVYCQSQGTNITWSWSEQKLPRQKPGNPTAPRSQQRRFAVCWRFLHSYPLLVPGCIPQNYIYIHTDAMHHICRRHALYMHTLLYRDTRR